VALVIQEQVPLAPLTTFELGGPARYYARIDDEADLAGAFRWASERGLATFVLGGGSNLVVADAGFDGLVVHPTMRGLSIAGDGATLHLTTRAGEPWDDVVAEAVRQNAGGIECLSGIPGLAGAAPVQNIGAYGQEVADVLDSVRVLDRSTLQSLTLSRDDCRFGYRDSVFRRHPDRFAIVEVTLKLTVGMPAALHYGELADAFDDGPSPSLAQVRATVLELRRRKSMLVDTSDPNRRSAGSFFTNPILGNDQIALVTARALDLGLIRSRLDLPCYAQPDGRVKLAAGWLIEHAGIDKGFRMGNLGISSRHALAIVHHGNGTTAELIQLALHVRASVLQRFGVALVPEPVFVGLAWPT
jgi:UDP-N-acetylmuramate dehydrogenase